MVHSGIEPGTFGFRPEFATTASLPLRSKVNNSLKRYPKSSSVNLFATLYRKKEKKKT